jgi:hypothetical protein
MKSSLLVLFFLALAQPAFAVDKKEAAPAAPTEVPKTPLTICTAEVSYKWKRVPPPPAVDLGVAPKKAKSAPVTATPDPEIYGTMESSALSLTESGEIESEVKARIASQLPAGLSKAMDICVDLHQNQGTCLTKKLGSVSSQLDRLDFETKKEIREQSIEDCKREHGVCISTSKSEITCRVEVLPTPAPTEAPAAGAKDTKKK